jgi:hypothetical protein
VFYRDVTGPVRLSDGSLMNTGTVEATLLYPIADGTDFIAPMTVEVPVQNGEIALSLAAPGSYKFRIISQIDKPKWSFDAPLGDDVSTPISLAQLFISSRVDSELPQRDPLVLTEGANVNLMGSGVAEEGEVPLADGQGGIAWGSEVILTDRVTSTRYRLYVENGVLQLEAV